MIYVFFIYTATMDVVLGPADQYFFTPYIYPSWMPEDNLLRQFISLNIITDIGGALVYLIPATLNYFLIFNKEILTHPLILQVSQNGFGPWPG